jgi:hypothetical protein
MVKLARTQVKAARESRLYITACAAVAVAALTCSASVIQRVSDAK